MVRALRAASAHCGVCVLGTKASRPVCVTNASFMPEISLISGILVEDCDGVRMTPESTLELDRIVAVKSGHGR